MQVPNLICYNCKHFREFQGGCDAFPNDIPEIIIRTNEHSEALEEQDNDIVFEPIED